jgi:hypothetical protein
MALAMALALSFPLVAVGPDTWEVEAATAFPASIGLVDPATGEWHLRGPDGWTTSFYYGNPGDLPMMGDWDCSGSETPGLYRQSDGYVYLRDSNTQGVADTRFFFGNPGDVPLAGDFNGDGCDTVSIYRPSEGRVFIINELGSGDQGLGAAETSYYFGNPGDKPFVGDFDGDGIETIGLHRESTGFVYFRNTHTQGVADNAFFFGDPGDRLVAGDWTGDGTDSPAVFRPSDTTFYFRHTNTQGNADDRLVLGDSGWLPVAGRFGLEPVPIDEREWSLSTVDAARDVGRFNDIAIGADGLPLITYGNAWAASVHELKTAHCTDRACTNASTATLGFTMFESTSIAINELGTPLISFYDPWSPGLAVATCADTACTAADLRIERPGEGYGKYTEAAFDSSGTAIIAASRSDIGGVDKLVRIAGSTEWVAQNIDANLHQHGRPSLAMGPDDRARIVIPGNPSGSAPKPDGSPTVLTYPLRLTTCPDPSCTFGLIDRVVIHEEVATDPGMLGDSTRAGAHTSVAVSPDSLPAAAISWVRGPGLDVIVCQDAACSERTVALIDAGLNAGRFVDLAFTPDGYPIMTYTDDTGIVRAAHCQDAACGSVAVATLADPGPGTEVSLALDRVGMPVIAFYDKTAGDLVVARLR